MEGKRLIWVVDSEDVLGQTYRNIGKEIAYDASGQATEAAAYASEAEQWEESGKLMDHARKLERTRFRVERIQSPRTGLGGYKVTW